MGKRKLITGMLIGAIVGGLATLFNRETRAYTKGKMVTYKEKTSQFMQQPSEAVRDTRLAFNQLNERFIHNAENVMNALEQVENTLEKVTGKKDEEKLPFN